MSDSDLAQSPDARRLAVVIRPETEADLDAITRVNDLAFEQPNEGGLVVKLRMRNDFVPGLSLVAVADGAVVGHILFTPVPIASETGYRSVVVLGHVWYYPKFGFVPASRWGIRMRFPAPDEAVMALELVPGALAGVRGEVRHPPEFDGV